MFKRIFNKSDLMIPVHDVQRESRWIDHILECYAEIDRLEKLTKHQGPISYDTRFDKWWKNIGLPTFRQTEPKI